MKYRDRFAVFISEAVLAEIPTFKNLIKKEKRKKQNMLAHTSIHKEII